MAAACADPDARLPAWIILDDEAYVEDSENATTAEGRTSSGLRVKVSFFAADPPRLSHFCLHRPDVNIGSFPRGWPCVLQTVDNVALISIANGGVSNPPDEYFFYRAAGQGWRPSIEPIPDIHSYLSGRLVDSVGFLPCGGDGDGYVVAALVIHVSSRPSDHELHVFRSERGTWTKTVLVLGRHKLVKVEKVIAMGAGKLGFVDLLKGILVCDVLSDNPTGRFVPLPKLLPANQGNVDGELCWARSFRDVAIYADGLIKCVEEEPLARRTIHKIPRVTKRRVVPEKLPEDVSNTDELQDSDLMPDPVDVEEVEMEEEETYQYLGWRVIAWSRTLSSTCWRKECLIHVDDIVADDNNPTHAALLGELEGSRAPGLTLKDLRVSYPSLSIDDSNALYLTTKVKPSTEEMCVIKVDMGKKTLEEISPVLTERQRFRLNYISCALSKYLNTDPDVTQVGTCSPPSPVRCCDNLIRASNFYRPSEYCSPTTPASRPCFGNRGYYPYQMRPPPPPPSLQRPPPPTVLLQRPPPPPGGHQIRGQSADSCSASSTTLQESGNQVIRVGAYSPHSPYYCGGLIQQACNYRPSTQYHGGYCCPRLTPASRPCFGNHQLRPPPPPRSSHQDIGED